MGSIRTLVLLAQLAVALPACSAWIDDGSPADPEDDDGASSERGADDDPDGVGDSPVAEETCPEAASVRGSDVDASELLQGCLDRTPEGGALALEPGAYSVGAQLRLDRAITLTTRGRHGSAACAADSAHGCAELVALPAMSEPFGMFLATAAVTIDHIVLNGNRQARVGSAAHDSCASGADNAPGFNAAMRCDGCAFRHSVSMYAVCGTGLLVTGDVDNAQPGREPIGTGIAIEDSAFAYNGRHRTPNLWADGLTVHDVTDSTFTGNRFIDNTDIDLIFGGCAGCTIRNNTVTHTADPEAGAYAAIMIQKWSTTSGRYENVEVSGNRIDCGPLLNCGSGLYIGSESWYDGTPYGTLADGETSGAITGNAVTNAMNAVYIAARGLAIHGNDFFNAHGTPIPTSCGNEITSETPIVVSPTTRSCHFNLENVDLPMSIHYSSASWAGCIPNYTPTAD